MKILTKLMLASAVLATSGFAAGTTINEDMVDQDGWDITGTDAATIAAGKTVIMQGVSGADSDLNVKDTASLTINGIVEMHDASAVTVESTASCSVNGMLDVQNVSDFSGYSGTVSGANGSVVYVPYPKATLKKASDNAFKVSVDQTSGSEVKVRYKTDGAELKTNETKVYIEVTGGCGTYADVAEVTGKTGIAFDDAANNAVLDPIGKSSFTMAEVLADEVNSEENINKTFDVGQDGLSDRNLNTTNATTIHFGLAGTNAVNDVFQYEVGAIEVKGDSSGMNGGIGTNGDLKFSGKAANGNMDVQGTLTFGYEGEQTLAGEIKAAAINIPAGSKVVLNKKLTTGYSAMKEIDLSKSTNIRDYAVSSLHRGTIPGIDSTVYYQNKTGTNTNTLFYRDASSANSDKLMETINLGQFAESWDDCIWISDGFRIYTSDSWWTGCQGIFGGEDFNGAWDLKFGDTFVIPANTEHSKIFKSALTDRPTNSGDYNRDPTDSEVKYICLTTLRQLNGVYFDKSKGEWLRMTEDMRRYFEGIGEASSSYAD